VCLRRSVSHVCSLIPPPWAPGRFCKLDGKAEGGVTGVGIAEGRMSLSAVRGFGALLWAKYKINGGSKMMTSRQRGCNLPRHFALF
jgi:hypothetical protein